VVCKDFICIDTGTVGFDCVLRAKGAGLGIRYFWNTGFNCAGYHLFDYVFCGTVKK
jgi:hypothetical protein